MFTKFVRSTANYLVVHRKKKKINPNFYYKKGVGQ